MNYKVRSVRPIENEPISEVTLEIAGEKPERLLVFSEFCRENGISVGDCDGETAERLRDCAGLTEAYGKGERLLAFSPNSEKALITKLRQRGVSADHARRAAQMLVQRGFIDDRENALAEAEKCVKKLWGARRILSELSAKGYRGEALCEARAFLEDVDFSASLSALIDKKYRKILSSGEERDIEKTVAALVRYGYTPREAIAAIRRAKC
ncbi:MAG: hypothetical protein E7640_05830 [Ruminococcaceae bacterium]|nr:hypothetical protein [Oscillospiraceae bacterium]